MRAAFGIVRVIALLLVPAAAQAQAGPEWSGVYAGVHLGQAWDRIHYREPDDPSFAVDPLVRGVQGGPIGGYRQRKGDLVFGVDASVSFGRLRRVADGVSDGNDYSQIDLDTRTHLRGTFGYAMGRTLLFAAAGVAVAKATIDDVDPEFGVDEATHTGATVGGGLERLIGGRGSVRVEYLFDSYGKQSYSLTAPEGPYFPAYGAEMDMRVQTLRAAFAFRF